MLGIGYNGYCAFGIEWVSLGGILRYIGIGCFRQQFNLCLSSLRLQIFALRPCLPRFLLLGQSGFAEFITFVRPCALGLRRGLAKVDPNVISQDLKQLSFLVDFTTCCDEVDLPMG